LGGVCQRRYQEFRSVTMEKYRVRLGSNERAGFT
jgi:hypothetical protein